MSPKIKLFILTIIVMKMLECGQERMIEGRKEERRSVNRPRVNEIFGQRSHASGYTIFST